MTPTVQLSSKDVRQIVAKFFNIPLSDVIPQRYGFAIANLPAEEIERRINQDER